MVQMKKLLAIIMFFVSTLGLTCKAATYAVVNFSSNPVIASYQYNTTTYSNVSIPARSGVYVDQNTQISIGTTAPQTVSSNSIITQAAPSSVVTVKAWSNLVKFYSLISNASPRAVILSYHSGPDHETTSALMPNNGTFVLVGKNNSMTIQDTSNIVPSFTVSSNILKNDVDYSIVIINNAYVLQ